jgi:hypothetical protein
MNQRMQLMARAGETDDMRRSLMMMKIQVLLLLVKRGIL